MNFDEDTLLLLLAICICQAVFLCQLPFKKYKNYKTGVKDWFPCRETFGSFSFKIAIIIIHFVLHNILLSLIFMHEGFL